MCRMEMESLSASRIQPVIFDAIIIGAGIGGIRAAKELVRAGIKTAMVASGEFCSGASFFPGTWGLGMVAPKNEEDKQDLLDNIDQVGCGLSNLKLSALLVDRVGEEIEKLARDGVEFKKAMDAEGVIPCFDRHKRSWFGFDFSSAKKSFSRLLSDQNFTVFEKNRVLEIYDYGSGSKGVLCMDKNNNLHLMKGKAIIIASGGFTSMYEYSFSTEPHSPLIHALAMKVGCELVNIEFIQFIPAYLRPLYKTVFNERAFRYVELKREDGSNAFEGIGNREDIMAERSTYGPFTSRLKSRIVDIEMFKYYKTCGSSVYFQYPEEIASMDDTLIFNYFHWLKEKNIDLMDKIYIMPFAHACNGGLKIDESAQTTVEGIFACGEVTGGVHGADRIGGLSTGNALVFGAIAGESAAAYCKETGFRDFSQPVYGNICHSPAEEEAYINIIKTFRKSLYDETAIIRSGESIRKARTGIERLKEEADNHNFSIQRKIQLETYFDFSKKLLDSMNRRKLSTGCHYRIDG